MFPWAIHIEELESNPLIIHRPTPPSLIENKLIKQMLAPGIQIARFELGNLQVVIIKSQLAVPVGAGTAGINERPVVMTTPIPDHLTGGKVVMQYSVTILCSGAADGAHVNHSSGLGSQRSFQLVRLIPAPHSSLL